MPVVPTPCGTPLDLWWAPNARPREVRVGRDTLFALEQGSGPPVLLLHGYTAELTHFRELLLGLAQAGFRAIALDFPGHGHSAKPPGRYDAERMVAAALATLDRLEIPRAHLVGHSMGGAVALALARLHPDRVDRLALLAPYAPGLPLGKTFGLWINTLAPIPLVAGLLMRLQDRKQFEAGNANAVVDVERLLALDDGRWRDQPWELFNLPGARAALASAGRHFAKSWRRVLPELPRLGERGLVVWGERDNIVLHAGMAPLSAATSARAIGFEGIGHCPHLEAPERLMPLLLEHFGVPQAKRESLP